MAEAAELAELTQLLGLEHPLAPEQAAVVTAPLDTALVVAGAGSGKTHTMSVRVAWLVWRGEVPPEAVLGLTFTRKAARELAERTRRRIDLLRRRGALPLEVDEHDQPLAQTYHAFAARLVEDNAARLHLDEARLLGPAAAWRLAEDVVRSWRGPLAVELSLRQVVSTVLALAGECAEHRLAPAGLAAALDDELTGLRADIDTGLARRAEDRTVVDRLAARRALVPLLDAYAARKRDLGLLDHGDQVLLAAEAAELPEVAADTRERFGAVLLDEYQDTSSAQTDLLAALFGRHPVTAVGDPHQSIFGWRGASAGTLGRFLTRFARADGGPPRQHTLATSWRNPTRVLDVANAVAGPLRAGANRGLEVPTLVARPDAGPGQVLASYVDTVDDESVLVARWLAEHRGPGRTQAVLCRKRSEMARVETALREAGLPVEVVGLGGLLDEPEVLDVVAALTAATDPERGDALVRLLTGPRWNLAPADLDGLEAWARELAGSDRDTASIVDALDELPPTDWSGRDAAALSPAGRDRLTEVARVLARIREAIGRPAAEAVSAAVAALGVDLDVAVASPDAVLARRTLDRFAAEAAAFADHEGRSSLPEFLAWLEVARTEERGLDGGEPAPPGDAVQVLTVHAAKGLEWHDVAVVDLTAGGFPSARSAPTSAKVWLTSLAAVPWPARGDADSLPAWRRAGAVSAKDWQDRLAEFTRAAGAHLLTEERRLAYVAVTRAQERLLLTAARWGPRSRPREPSPFLLEACEAGAARWYWAEATEEPPSEAIEGTWPWPPDTAEVREALSVAAAAVGRADPAAPPGSTMSAEAAQWAPLVDRLLAERDERVRAQAPGQLSASQVVALAGDTEALLTDLARPVPTQPSTAARRGTRFHEWVERKFAAGALIDPDELGGAGEEDWLHDGDLEALKASFESSEWAEAEVVAVELPFSTPLDTPDGRVVLRGRIDAVVRRPDGGLDVVDWKTGRPPGGAVARARAVQLAVYRLAVARLYGVDLAAVGGAFWYGATGETVRPVALQDEDAISALVSQVTAG